MTRLERLKNLTQYMENKPVVWGEDDCTMTPCRWVADETGFDLYTIDYSTKEEAHKLIEEKGGLLSIWEKTLSPHLVKNFGMPNIGDVAIIDTRLFGHVGMIFSEYGMSLWRSENGMKFMSPRKHTIVSCWSVPDNTSE